MDIASRLPGSIDTEAVIPSSKKPDSSSNHSDHNGSGPGTDVSGPGTDVSGRGKLQTADTEQTANNIVRNRQGSRENASESSNIEKITDQKNEADLQQNRSQNGNIPDRNTDGSIRDAESDRGENGTKSDGEKNASQADREKKPHGIYVNPIIRSIYSGRYDNFEDDRYGVPGMVEILKCEMVAGFGFALSIALSATPITDFPMLTTGHSTLERFLMLIFMTVKTMTPVFWFTMCYDVYEGHSWENFRWYFIRVFLVVQPLAFIVIEITVTAYQRPDSALRQFDQHTKELILLTMFLTIGAMGLPLAEGIARQIGVRKWKSLYYCLVKTQKEIPNQRKFILRVMFRSYWLCTSYVGCLVWVLFDFVILHHQKELVWKLARPCVFLLLKKNLWIVTNWLYNRRLFGLPQAIHYSGSNAFSIGGVLTTMYLSVTSGWDEFLLFMTADWCAFFLRFWVFTGKNDDVRTLHWIRRTAFKFALQTKNAAHERQAHGWLLICEGFWQTAAYLMVLMLYPLSLILDSIFDETTGTHGLLKWVFYRTDRSTAFLVIAFCNDFFQDIVVHNYVTKETKCQYTRHLGVKNWKGRTRFFIGGWINLWLVPALCISLKIAKDRSENSANSR